MKLSHWPNGDYPIYLEPTAYELTCLLGSGWDTLRGALYSKFETLHLGVASGYGNTHDSINNMAMRYGYHFPTDEFIVYRQQNRLYVNFTQTGPERTPIRKAIELAPDLKSFFVRVMEWFDSYLLEKVNATESD